MKRYIVIAALAAVCTLAACSAPDVASTQRAFDESRELLVTETQRYQIAYEDALARGDEKAAERAKKSLETLARLEEQRARGEAALQQVVTPDGGIDAEGVGRLASDFLPYPFNLIAVFGAGAAAWFIRQRKVNELDKAAKSIVNAIDAARMNDPALTEALKRNGAAISGQLTPAAKAIVESESIAPPEKPVV